MSGHKLRTEGAVEVQEVLRAPGSWQTGTAGSSQADTALYRCTSACPLHVQSRFFWLVLTDARTIGQQLSVLTAVGQEGMLPCTGIALHLQASLPQAVACKTLL